MKGNERNERKIKGLFLITRPINWSMAGIAVIAGALAEVDWSLDLLSVIGAAFFATVFVTIFGNVLNDICDRNIDKKVHKKRPLALGMISLRAAKIFALVSLLIGSVSTILIGRAMCLFILAINIAAIISYEAFLKEKGFPGNLIIGYLVCSAFLFGGAAVGEITFEKIAFSVVLMAILAFSANVGREIIKDIIDMLGDRGRRNTLPMRIGIGKAKGTAILFIGLAIALSFLLWHLQVLGKNPNIYAFLAAAIGLFITSMFLLSPRRELHIKVADITLKVAMFIALFSFVLGGIF